jgi:hypothetical protein
LLFNHRANRRRVQVLRPLYADGTIRAEAQALHTRIALPHLPPFPHDLLAAVGLGGDDLASIRNILAAYDRTNAMALIALSALLCRLDGVPAESGQAALGTPEQSAAPPSAISLAPLPGLDALSEPIASLVLTLSWALIAPLDVGGSLERPIADALTKARTQAARLAMRLRPPPLDPAAEEAVRCAVEAFAGDVIAKMVVIRTLLHAATRDQVQKEGRPA